MWKMLNHKVLLHCILIHLYEKQIRLWYIKMLWTKLLIYLSLNIDFIMPNIMLMNKRWLKSWILSKNHENNLVYPDFLILLSITVNLKLRWSILEMPVVRLIPSHNCHIFFSSNINRDGNNIFILNSLIFSLEIMLW